MALCVCQLSVGASYWRIQLSRSPTSAVMGGRAMPSITHHQFNLMMSIAKSDPGIPVEGMDPNTPRGQPMLGSWQDHRRQSNSIGSNHYSSFSNGWEFILSIIFTYTAIFGGRGFSIEVVCSSDASRSERHLFQWAAHCWSERLRAFNGLAHAATILERGFHNR